MKVDAHELCVYCPRLCRDVCPVAVGSGREAATPTAVMTAPWLAARGLLDPAEAGRAAALCTACGACEAHCKLHRPVPSLLALARGELLPAPILGPLPPISGAGAWIAVEPDGRRWAAALAEWWGEPIAGMVDPDDLGAPLLDHPAEFQARGALLREAVGDRGLVVATAAAARAAAALGLRHRHLADHVPAPVDRAILPPCGAVDGPDPLLRCCGAGEPLSRHHPPVAAAVGAAAAAGLGGRRTFAADARCAAHLRRFGADLLDPIDILIGGAPPPSE